MKKRIYYLFATMTIFFVSCDKFGTINTNPNGGIQPLSSALLTNAETQLGGAATIVLDGLYGQYFSQTLYTDASRYSAQTANWTDYQGTLKDIQAIIDLNTDEATKVYASYQGSNANQLACARILRAYRFSVITDRYGDIPYTEALHIVDGGLKLDAAYDSQESIYHDLFKELSEAVDQFDDGPFAKGDILFGGSKTKWRKFANTQRVILALRVSKVDPDFGKTQFLAALAATDGVIESSSDDVKLTYPGNATQFYDPWFNLAGDQNVSATIGDILNTNNDPRIAVYGKPVSGKIVGFPYGLQRQEAIDWDNNHDGNTLILNDPWRATTSTLPILTAADTWLARSEAALLGWATDVDAQTAYTNGLDASFATWGITDAAAIATYEGLAVNTLNGTLAQNLEKVGVQRWTTFYPNATEGWSEWRRTGFPDLEPAPLPINNSKKIPIRLVYPNIEYGLNTKSVTAAAAKLDHGDADDSHVWWDVD